MKNFNLKFWLTILIVGLVSTLSFAQGDPEDPEIPIDGGITILMGIAALLGGKKLFSKFKKV